jgi:hypothetical protein
LRHKAFELRFVTTLTISEGQTLDVIVMVKTSNLKLFGEEGAKNCFAMRSAIVTGGRQPSYARFGFHEWPTPLGDRLVSK